MFPVQVGRIDWIYPPPMLIPGIAISHLPFETAFFVWTLTQVMVTAVLLRWARLSWTIVGLTLLSPAALWSFEMGQLSVLTSCIFFVALQMCSEQPGRSGVVLAALSLKPQAGLLAPLALLAGRNYAAFCAFLATCLLVIAISVAVTGPASWFAFLTLGRSAAQTVLQRPFGLGYQQFGISTFWMARSFGAGLVLAYACQIAVSAVGMLACGIVWRSPSLAAELRASLTVFLSLLVTPYGFTYDMVGYSAALAVLAQRRNWRLGLFDVLFWLWPMLCPVVVMKTGVLLTPLVVLLAVARTWYRAGLKLPLLPSRVSVLPGHFVGAADGKK